MERSSPICSVIDAVGINVDLLTEKAIKPQILKEITKDMILVYG